MIDEWANGVNQFSRLGESLWGLWIKEELIGIGGLNIDPYVADTNVGRLRHLYIAPQHRKKGYATWLVQQIIAQAKLHFNLLRLYTPSEEAGLFYLKAGFKMVSGYKVSHQFALNES